MAELEVCNEDKNYSGQGGAVNLVRVGILKDILVPNYVNMNIVLMVVSWMAKDREMQPKLRRDMHGFLMANMEIMPWCTKEAYILPSLASQVHIMYRAIDSQFFRLKWGLGNMEPDGP